MLQRAGRFKAQVLDAGVGESGPNNLLTFTPRFVVTHELQAGEWVDVAHEYLDITAFVYLEKRDGSMNTRAIQNLKDSFGWDGSDPFWLQDNDLPDCQITVEMDEYQGKVRPKVQWINHLDSEGGLAVVKSGDADRRRILARVGAKFRALGGGKPPAKAAPKPAPKAAPAPVPVEEGEAATQEEAWAEFARVAQEKGWDDEKLNGEWFGAIEATTGGRDYAKVTPAQWAAVKSLADTPF